MLVQHKEKDVYLNFVNSIKSQVSKRVYDVGDSKLVDFYCIECFNKAKNHLDKRLDNINFT